MLWVLLCEGQVALQASLVQLGGLPQPHLPCADQQGPVCAG